MSASVHTLSVAGLPVEVRRSARRRTLALQVRGGVVTAYAPTRLPEATIRAFVEAKRDWLTRHLDRQAQAAAPLAPAPGDGSVVSFLDEVLTLRVVPALARSERVGDELRLPAADPAGLAAQVRAWRHAATPEPYTRLVRDYATRLGALDRLGTVRVSDTRSRWGSCTARGDIRLHWALSAAPLPVLEYVALHEAAHLLELNHSPRYWAHVARLMPGHQEQRAWLRTHGAKLLT
ncbi:M48 family metallopeptidase [Deinococcus petrolearius]|uniref:M48 family metallopeptidase n=1 Tax=Deinococcus petrolearius TaxID=1751295 RepID=A0ABW1DLI1_9DEIO